ncbi:SusC/RagA family TonB-linked outer membrane protein [Pedobacter sp.]|uniref:SusC/RagA family TonB-linked outer membrane protein n=1 Tax=Pedobacter sp. TaxID=1411316 RepID=UPI003C554ED0
MKKTTIDIVMALLCPKFYKPPCIDQAQYSLENSGLNSLKKLCFSHLRMEALQRKRTFPLLLLLLLLNNLSLNSQIKPYPIIGSVKNAAGISLSGVTVILKNQQKTTLSDSVGNFNLNASQRKGILTLSMVGYKTIETHYDLSQQTNFQITLEPDEKQLEEVQILSTGYQNLPKERATGSFTQVKMNAFNEQTSSDLFQRLESITNGLSTFKNGANGAKQLMVRGLSTIGGPTAPLIVLDNFPYEGDLANLNPNDIESVTILKDAAAASIWGTRAGNGVIVITTKKGKLESPLRIEVTSNFNLSGKLDLNYLTSISSKDFIDFEKFLYSRGYYNAQINSTQYPVLSPVVQLLLRATKGTITQEAAENQINALSTLDARNDYENEVYKSGLSQNHFLSIRGGSRDVLYAFSGGYDRNINELSATFQKLNLRSEATFNLSTKLNLTTTFAYTQSENQSGKSQYGSIANMVPYQRLVNDDGSAAIANQTYSQDFKNAVPAGFLDWNYYPLTDYQYSRSKSSINDFTGRLGLNYRAFSWLNFDLKYQYENQTTAIQNLNDAQSYFARNLINSYTNVSGSTLTNAIPKGGIMDYSNSLLTSHNLRGQINLDKKINAHNLTLMLGEEIRSVANNSRSDRTYGYNSEILSSSPVDFRTPYPNYVTKNSSLIPYNKSFSSTRYNFLSLYANGAYTYQDKYTLSASLRRDASNLFGLETNDKWTPLWSAGASWRLSREAFFKSSWVDELTIRATYGFSGNIDPSKSAATTIAYTTTSIYTNSPRAQVSNFLNPDLRWEKVRTINAGVNFSFFKARLSGSVDWYQKNATDLYANVPIDYTAGLAIATVTKNVASMRGRGMDIEINSQNLLGAISWNTSLNLNLYRDKVLSYYLASGSASRFVNNNRSPKEGYPVWAAYGFKWGGLDANGNPQGYLNGQPSQNYSLINGAGTQFSDLSFLGPRMPTLYGSIGNTFGYRGLSLSMRMSFGFGHYFRRQSINYSTLMTQGYGNSDFANRWQVPGDEAKTNIPAPVYPLVANRDNFFAGSEILLEKADFLRLQYVTLSYDLQKKHLKNLPLQTLKVYANLNNIGLLWRANNFGIDPEASTTNTQTPSPLSISAGVKIGL